MYINIDSIVIRHFNTLEDFHVVHFVVALLLRRLAQILYNALLHPFPSFKWLSISPKDLATNQSPLSQNRGLFDWHQITVILNANHVQHPKTVNMRLVLWRCDDAVDARFQISVYNISILIYL